MTAVEITLEGRQVDAYNAALEMSYIEAVLTGDHDVAAWAWMIRSTREGTNQNPPRGGELGVACPECWRTQPNCACVPQMVGMVDEVLSAHGLDVESFPWEYGDRGSVG